MEARPGSPLRLSRARRLKRRRLIRPLFDRARADVGRVRAGTVQIVWRLAPRADVGTESTLQAGFAPGRRRTAVVRNRIRRVLRETFRVHAAPLAARLADRPDTLTLFVLYRGRDDTAARDIRRDLPDALARLARRDLPPPVRSTADRPPSGNPAPPAP